MKAERWRIDDEELLANTLESPLNCKEIQPVHSEGDQPWDFFARNDAKAETPILCPPHAKSWLIGKDSDAGRDWGQEEKWSTEDEVAGWHHWLDGRESEWSPEVGDGQGGLECCDSWGCKELDMTEWLNWTENKNTLHLKISSPIFFLLVFLGGSDSKESACNAGDPSSIPGLGRSLGEGNGSPLHYSYLENSMDWGAWQSTVHGVTKSQAQLSG